MPTETVNIEELRAQYEAAKAQVNEARQAGDEDAITSAVKERDRLRSAVKRAEGRVASGNGRGDTGQVKRQAQASRKRGGQSGSTSRSRSRSKSNPRKAQRTADDFADPIALGVVVKANSKPKVLDRTEKGNKLRATRKNRETGTHVSIIDAKLDRRFSKQARENECRWVTLEEESGEAALHPTWEGACFYARTPSVWSAYSAAIAQGS